MPADIIYRRALVTFIDILGFRELVASRSPSEVREIIRQVQSFGTQADHDLDEEVSDDEVNWTRTFAFSDSIIRIRPFDSDFRAGALFQETLALVHMQGELADLGVLSAEA
jgi:hypothetical protein